VLQPAAATESTSTSPLLKNVAAHPLAQQYGTLLHALCGRDEQQKTAAGVTSIQRGAGATTVTLNLAWRAASEGTTVLVVDLDTEGRDLTRRLRGRSRCGSASRDPARCARGGWGPRIPGAADCGDRTGR